MTHDSMIAVIQAHKEDKTIQFKLVGQQQEDWRDCDSKNNSWNFAATIFRIKPKEPKKVKLLAYLEDGTELRHCRDDAHYPSNWIRIPTLDMEIILP